MYMAMHLNMMASAVIDRFVCLWYQHESYMFEWFSKEAQKDG